MTTKDEDEKKRLAELAEEEGESGEGEGGISGQTGEIKFRYRDILSTEPRDDVLPEAEIRRLLLVHEDIHKERVDKQKATRKERDDIKNGRVNANSYDGLGLRKGGGGGGGNSPYKQHPVSNHAQFSGATDRKITGVPSDSLAETNDDIKQDLLDKLDLRFQHKNVPKFNPTPRPY